MNILFLAIISLTSLFHMDSNYTQDKNIQTDKIELVVVFKKNIELASTIKILDKAKVEYREGMDSSKGKGYFYKTGPKFILTFQTLQKKNSFLSEYQKMDEIHEIYSPDWSIQKD